MMGGYWYVGPAPDGRRFCYAKTPTFHCPVALDAEAAKRGTGEAAGASTLAAAALLGVRPDWLAARLSWAGGHVRARVDDKLTDRCRCGAKMERLGFAIWVERERHVDDSRARIAGRLGFEDTERIGATRYADTKREAQAWAHDELKAARAAEG